MTRPGCGMLASVFNQPLIEFLRYLDQRPVSRLVHARLDIWDVYIRKRPRGWLPLLPGKTELREYASHVSLTWNFVKEIHDLAPRQFWVYCLNKLWVSLESVLSAYTADRVVNAVIDLWHNPNADVGYIIPVIALRVSFIIWKNLVEKLVRKDVELLESRIFFHFLQKPINGGLVSEHDHQRQVVWPYLGIFAYADTSIALEAFQNLMGTISSSIILISQLGYNYTIIKRLPLDPAFIIINALPTLARFGTRDSLWMHDVYCHIFSKPYKRMLALYRLISGKEYETDIKSDGLGNYIEREFDRCRKEVGDVPIGSVDEHWSSTTSFYRETFNDLLGAAPTLYFAVRLVLDPKSLSPSSYVQFQKAADTIESSMNTVLRTQLDFSQFLPAIRDIYQQKELDREFLERERQLTPYPRGEAKNPCSGMEIEFRNVSFSYPGTSKMAIQNVSFLIKPGQLVAIVGVNGSGKSTITKLFNRLCDPTEGEIFVDGLLMKSYRRTDIRQAMAILRQNHTLYPLSLRENIALGLPDSSYSQEDLDIALEYGGATSIIEKLPDKLETELQPVRSSYSNMDLTDDDAILAPLNAIESKQIEKDVSGGECQRLAASRTFMRLRGGDIRFLAADEPTSALDPEGESELFTRLRQQRGDMTVVFITHRFGHITKYADLILCMKDGNLIEQGSHEDLIAKGGEYYKLHSIQAEAF